MNGQESSDAVTGIVSAFSAESRRLQRDGLLVAPSAYSGRAGDDLECVLVRGADRRRVTVAAYGPLYEVAVLDIDGEYSDVATGYDVEEQIENVDTFLVAAEKFVRGQYSEVQYVSERGRRVGGRITFVAGGGVDGRGYSLSSPPGVGGLLRRAFARPEPRPPGQDRGPL